MKVMVNNHLYQMNKEQFKGILKIAKGNVKNGIIAIEKDGVTEMRKDSFSSNSARKRKVKEFEALGYKVYTS